MTAITATFERRQSVAAQSAAMALRAMLAFIRQPATVIPSVVFPLFFAALGTASFGRAPDALPDFPPVDSFLDFALAGAIVQGVLFGSLISATALATDIETGYFDRLLATPTSRTSILVGRLAGAMALGGVQTLLFTVVMLPFGLTVKSGVVGVAVMLVGGVFTALAIGALLSSMALRTGSSEAVQGSFPLLFMLLFFSSTFFPRETMSGAYQVIATINPISHLVEGFRALVIDGLTAEALARTLLIPATAAVLTVGLALRSLSRRLASK